MFNLESLIFPTALGIFGGFLGPILVEKWKGSENNSKKQIFMEAEIQKTEEKLTSFVQSMETRLSSVENQLKTIELTLSHNTGALKSRLPDIPLKEPLEGQHE
ncbi:MAG: hypothetical protein Q8S21_04250 [Candidatus Paracaedibacteraceae bacterium]|nr:hypothetical protein [Candidatus Paracaedibacteraceae bacterium]